ncbi:MAG: ParB N-terminal domain-containing protein, partial [Firmicutes bacterium]|nr:ParB N-terminal domain-containing protein [Bacillota bacterium]
MPKKKEFDPTKVLEVKLSELHPFKNHPFKVLDDDLMQQTVDSITQVGVLSPAVVRPHPDGGYEIISGHRRLKACELAGLETMPVIVKDLTDDEAV